MDRDGDGWTPVDGDCDDADPYVFPGAVDTVGDELDSDCDGADTSSTRLTGAAGVTAQDVDDPSWLAFGKVLDVGNVDADPEYEILVGSDHLTDQGSTHPGVAVVLDGAALAQVSSWHGSDPDTPGEDWMGRGVAILSSTAGPQLLLLDGMLQLWVVDPSGPSGRPEEIGGHLIDAAPYQDSLRPSDNVAAFDVVGTPDEDVVVDCWGPTGDYASVCVLAGPIVADTDLSSSDLVVTGEFRDPIGFAGADLDGDGTNDLVVGATREADNAGGAFLFLGPAFLGWTGTAQADRAWLGENPGDWFGSDFGHADLDGDGAADLVAAAMAWPDNERRGRVYGLSVDTPTAREATFILDGDPGLQHFGLVVDTGDLNDDGQSDLAVGSPAYPLDSSVPGRVLVFLGPLLGSHAAAEADFSFAGERPGDAAGISLAIGDVTGDAVDDLVVGASENDQLAIDAGKVYLLPGPLGSR